MVKYHIPLRSKFYPISERMSCVTFQLKPVRSLDSLRSAWSGRLRHGPLPYSFSQNSTDIPPKPKSLPDPPRELLSNQVFDLYSNKFPQNSESNSNLQSKKDYLNSQLVDTTPLINISPVKPKNRNEYINPSNPFANRQVLKSEINGGVVRTEKDGKVSGTLLFKDPFEVDSLIKTSLQDPFDTSRVLIPMNPTFHSMNHQLSINSHPSPPLNTELHSSHAKVNTITHFFSVLQNFCFCRFLSQSYLL